MKIWYLSVALLLSSCGLLGGLVPDQELQGDALGLDNQTSDTTLGTLAATPIRLQAVGASGVASGTFDDLEPLPANTPIPASFAVTPRLKRMAFLGMGCTANAASYDITFGKIKLKLKDRIGQPNQRNYELENTESVVITFTKQGNEYVPSSSGFMSAATAFAIIWSQIAEIVTKENGVNTPNTGELSYQVSSNDNSLNNCTLRLTFGAAKGTIKFK